MDSTKDCPKKATSATGAELSKADDYIDNGAIQDLGYQQSYRRVLKTIASVCLVIALTTPLSAILVSAFYQVSYGGYFGLTWGWIIPSVILFPQVLAISELCSSMPVNGAMYWWTAALAPESWSRCLGFISGWINLFGLFTGVASFAYAVASGLAYSILIARPDWSCTNAMIMAMALGVVVFWVVSMMLRLENVTLAYMICAVVILCHVILFLIALPVSHAVQGMPFPSARVVFGSYQNYTDWEPAVAVPFTWFCAAWVNSIWMAPAFVVEETHSPRTSAPKAMIGSYISTCVMGLFVTIISAFCIADMDSIAMDPSGYPLYQLLIDHWGQQKSAAFLLFIAPFSTFGGSGMLLTYSTQIAAFARDGGLPFAKHLTYVNQRLSLPVNAVLVLAAGTSLILLISLSTSAKEIIYSLTVLCGLINAAIPVGLRLFAGDRWVPGPWNYGRWSKPIHALAVISQVYFIIMESFPLYKSWDINTFNYNWAVTVSIIILSCLLYVTWGKSFPGIPLEAFHRSTAEDH
ncbi:hypothetical protein N7494_001847 [Penicillium frequentans]|uniref:Amino acid transporter n=1 Tax=Penicillium frequentans TaxID=3151616 RepID=A0AAD6D2W1_9EURO|nr:hypothetical protein N7494_001847 [Penicillium glabrum]